jgi:hypothetical protein
MAMAAAGPDVATILGLLVAATSVAVAVRHVRLPYEVALVLTGQGWPSSQGCPKSPSPIR